MKTEDEIKREYPSLCYSCERARRVASESNEQLGFVGCAIRVKCCTEQVSEDDIIEINTLAEGWVDLRAVPFGKSSGIITNLQIVTKGVSSCGAYIANQKTIKSNINGLKK